MLRSNGVCCFLLRSAGVVLRSDWVYCRSAKVCRVLLWSARSCSGLLESGESAFAYWALIGSLEVC